jgi:4-azaleucine resistance transporter AzlC
VGKAVDRALLRDVGAVAAAVLMVGASFGAIAVSEGVSPWLVAGMSALVFAGGAQFMTLGVLASGGSAVAALVAALLLNVRHLPFGLAVADVLGRHRLIGSHLLVDESVAFALAQRDASRRRAAYWTCGIALFLAWNIGSLAGALAGQVVGDPDALGLDAAFPAGLLALLMPSLRESPAVGVALVGAAVAVATTPLLPAGLPVLLAVVGLVAAIRRPVRRSR